METDDKRVVQVAGDRVDPRLAGATLSDFRAAGDSQSSEGVLVVDVDRDSAAWLRGLRTGDIINGANGRRIRFLVDLWQRMRIARAVELRVYRAGKFGFIRL